MSSSQECEYTCGIIEESLEDKTVLDSLAPWFVNERVQEMPGEPEGVWHVRQYMVPAGMLRRTLELLEQAIRREWYAHLFNTERGQLHVVFHGRHFSLPAVRDSTWEEMISYGLTVGVDRKWTENISLRV